METLLHLPAVWRPRRSLSFPDHLSSLTSSLASWFRAHTRPAPASLHRYRSLCNRSGQPGLCWNCYLSLAAPSPTTALDAARPHGFDPARTTNDIASHLYSILPPSAGPFRRPRVCAHLEYHCVESISSLSGKRAGAKDFDAISSRWITVSLAKGPIALRTLYVYI